MNATLAEVAALSFEHLSRQPHVGPAKIRNLVGLLQRIIEARSTYDTATKRVDERQTGVKPAACDITPLEWSNWCDKILAHDVRHEPIGRIVERLHDVPRNMWTIPLDYFAQLSLAELRQLPRFGARGFRATIHAFKVLHAALSAVDRSSVLTSTVGPRGVGDAERWIVDVLCNGRFVTPSDVTADVVAPLLEVLRNDLGTAAAETAGARFQQFGDDAAPTASLERGKARPMSYARAHQIRRLAALALHARWPRGTKFVSALLPWVREIGGDDRRRAFVSATRMLFPDLSRRDVRDDSDPFGADLPTKQ